MAREQVTRKNLELSSCLRKEEEVCNTLTSSPKGRNRCASWFYTLNNYTHEELSYMLGKIWRLKTFVNGKDKIFVDLHVLQKEIGAADTPHLQGVVRFKNQVSFSTLKGINKRIRWDAVRSLEKCINYCSKDRTRDGLKDEALYTYGIKGTRYEKNLWTKDFETKEQMKTRVNLDMKRQALEDENIKKICDDLKNIGWVGHV